MKYKDFVTSFVRAWNFTRSETYQILESLDDKKLQFKPQGQKWQPLYWQFGCLARTQLVYAQAIACGFIDFSLFNSEDLPKKDQFQTKEEIKKLLEKSGYKWTQAIRSKRMVEEFVIRWPGFKMSLPVHINALIAHERLHHGQFISYLTLANFELPPNFKKNWAL